MKNRSILTVILVVAAGTVSASEMRPMMSLEIAKMASDACEAYQAET